MKLHVGGTYKINFVGMTSAFTVKRLDSQSDMALVIDVMGKDQKAVSYTHLTLPTNREV